MALCCPNMGVFIQLSIVSSVIICANKLVVLHDILYRRKYNYETYFVILELTPPRATISVYELNKKEKGVCYNNTAKFLSNMWHNYV